MTLKQMFASMASIASLSAFAGPDWNGRTDNSWWTVENWETGSWPKDEQQQTIVPAEVPSSMVEPYFGWQIDDRSATTINLGGRDRPITATGNFDVCKDGYEITFTNGSISVNGCLLVSTDKQTENVVMRLKDVDLTCSDIQIGQLWAAPGCGTFIVDSGTVSAVNMWMVQDGTETSTFVMNGGETRLHFLSCSAKGGGDGRIELNGGTLKVPDFSYVNWVAPLNEENGTTNINMTLVFNGGTLKAWPNNSDTVFGYNFVPVWMKTVIGEGGVIIDSNGYDVTFGATNITAVANDGGLTKRGAGTLKVNEGVVWGGPTKVLGGTLDLNGGTITGPLVLGGDGKIVNATIQTTDITIMEGYEFDSSEFSTVDSSSRWSLGSLVIRGTGTVLSPRNSLLKSATAWYDPSDATTLTCDENHGVTAVANKSATGSSMNSTLFSDQGFFDRDDIHSTQAEPPYVGTINNLGAIAFTNNVTGFRSNSEVNFAETFGKSVFAVLQRDESMLGDGYVQGYYRSHAEVYPIEWCGGGWIWDSTGVFGTAGQNDNMQYYYYTPPDESSGNGHWEWRSISDGTKVFRDTVPYVTSLRATSAPEGDAPNVFARVTGMVDGDVLDMTGSQTATLGRNDWARERIAYGWSMGHYRPSNGLVGEAVAFNRYLNEGEANILQSYLLHKWISPSIEEVGVLHIDDLSIDGTGDFDGSRLEVADLSGSGTVDNALGLKVTGTITARIDADEPAFSADCQVDLTGTTLALDESEFELAVYGQTATVFTATCITGTPTVQLAEGDRRRIKVRNTGVAIVVERVNPGLAVLIR